MSPANNPWKQIDKPATGFNVILIDAAHPHSFYWGRDSHGNYLFLLEIEYELINALQQRKIELKGIHSDIRMNQKTGKYVYVLSLESLKNNDIFQRLCEDLVSSTRRVEKTNEVLEVIYERLKQWKSFLSSKKKHLLTAHEIQGLYCELSFIEQCIDDVNLDISILINGWEGPKSGPNDFILGDFAVEIKSISGSQKNTVRISSEDQLSSHLDKLYLAVFILSEYHSGTTGTSLNTIARRVRDKIRDDGIRDEFDFRLSETGYIELEEYDLPLYEVRKRMVYEVREGFPRIVPNALSEGLSNVSYDLSLSAVKAYISQLPLEDVHYE